VTIAGNTTFGNAGANYAINFSGPVTLTGDRTLTSATSLNATTFSGVIGDGGNGYGITKVGSGTALSLTNANTYKGATTLMSGTVSVGNSLALQNSTVVIDAGTGLVTWQPTITAATIGGLSGTRNVSLLNTAGTPAAVAISIGNNDSNTSYSGILSGTGASLNKIGTGKLTFTGAGNTYTGGTTITRGSLIANNTSNSATGSGAVAVNGTSATVYGVLGGGLGLSTGGTLPVGAAAGGATSKTYAANSVGGISGAVNVNTAGHLAPGNSVGTLTVGGLTLAGGSILDYEFNNAANDFTASTAALALNGGGFNLYDEGTTAAFDDAGVYNLFGYATLTGSVTNLSVLNPVTGRTYTFSNDAANKLIQLTIAVPEPGSLGVLAVAGIGLLRRRRIASL